MKSDNQSKESEYYSKEVLGTVGPSIISVCTEHISADEHFLRYRSNLLRLFCDDEAIATDEDMVLSLDLAEIA